MLSKLSALTGIAVLSVGEQKNVKGGMCQAYCSDGSPSVNCHCAYCTTGVDEAGNPIGICYPVNGAPYECECAAA